MTTMTSIEIAKRTHCFAEDHIWYELLGQCYSEEEALTMVERITSAYDDFVHNLGPAKAAEAMKRNGGTMWYIDDLHNNEAPKIGDRLWQIVTTYWAGVLAVRQQQEADAARRQLFPQPNPKPDTWESLTDYDEDYDDKEEEETGCDEYYDDEEEKEETHTTAQTKRAGRKQETIDTLPKMQQKAEELKKIMVNKNLPLTVTTTSLNDEVNQCIISFVAQWATDRKCLQEPHGTMVGRFLREVCGFTAEGIAWKTWCAHVAPEIPELFKNKYKK